MYTKTKFKKAVTVFDASLSFGIRVIRRFLSTVYEYETTIA